MVKLEGGQRRGCAELQSIGSVLQTMQQQREEDRVLARTLSPLDKALPAKRNSKKARRTGRVQGRVGELFIHVRRDGNREVC